MMEQILKAAGIEMGPIGFKSTEATQIILDVAAGRVPDLTLLEASRQIDRARREIELLAILAAGPRRGTKILNELGFTPQHCRHEDTALICEVLMDDAGYAMSGVAPMTKAEIGVSCAQALIGHHLWDDNDNRTFVSGGMRWSCGSIAALLESCTFDGELLASITRELMATAGKVAA